MYDRSPLHGTVVPRIGRLTDFHLVFSIMENLIVWTFSLSVNVEHVAVGFAFTLCRRDWTIDIGIHVRSYFFQILPGVFCKMKNCYLQQNNTSTFERSDCLVTNPPCTRFARCSSYPTQSWFRTYIPPVSPPRENCPFSRVSCSNREDYDTPDLESRRRW